MTDSVDPYPTAPEEQSDSGLHCLLRRNARVFSVKNGNLPIITC